MTKKLKKLSAWLLLLLLLCLAGCAEKTESVPAENTTAESLPEETAGEKTLPELTIVYTNDIHSYIYNTVTDEDGNEVPGLRLSNVAAMVEDLRSEGKNVLLVDAGDEVQGSVYGSYDNGKSIIEIMNACGFQLSTPGNHDFDYGMDTFFALTEQADYPFISCNFLNAGDKTAVFPGTAILETGGMKIAFVGISTPSSITTSTPAYFQDGNGNYLYTFAGLENIQDLYDSVQEAVDSVRGEADYVIALGHLGIVMDEKNQGMSSEAVIAHTEGIDAFIDAHSHNTVEGVWVENKNGEEVLLTQTGAYMKAVGVMTFSENGEISSELLTEYDNADSEIAAMEESLNETIQEQLGEKVARLDTTLHIFDPEQTDIRRIRSMEMNAGDFVADSVYWFLNEELQLDCDIAIENGGGVRCQLETGDISCLDLINICPFGNQICLIESTGQEIIEALEKGAFCCGLWSEEWDAPAESGGFLQVAGLRYTVDASVESSVVSDENGNFLSVDGEYRVKNVQVYNRETGTYDDLEADKIYRIGGTNYILRNSGDGYAQFADNPLVVDFVGQDSDILTQYARNFSGADGEIVIRSENSPLATLEGYDLDYENPYGSGRITIENAEY